MPTYSLAKLAQVATDCGALFSPVFVGQLLADPRHTSNSIAAVLCTTPEAFAIALAKPEPTVYAPMTSSNV